MYGIIRVMIIVNKNLGSNIYTGRLLITLGLLSIGTAAFFILVQRDFKRLLAYSSIEHMGIIALGIGLFTPLSIFGALFHLLNHAVTKSMLFLASGNIYLRYETKHISKIKGVIKNMPVSGSVFLLGMFAIIGMPPFSIFSSELNIIIASFNKGQYVISGILLLFLTMIFAGFMARLSGMLFGQTMNSQHGTGEINKISCVVIMILLVIAGITGIYMPAAIKQLIDSCIGIINL
jgi:hydrogenase-4 component F